MQKHLGIIIKVSSFDWKLLTNKEKFVQTAFIFRHQKNTRQNFKKGFLLER